MNTLTDENILNLSKRLNDKHKIRQFGLKLGLSADEIDNQLDKHSQDTSEGVYRMLRSWMCRIKDRQEAHSKLQEALNEAGLNLYNSEILTAPSQVERKSNSFRIMTVVGILVVISAFLLGRWT